jgi:phosphate:Na+ symporter
MNDVDFDYWLFIAGLGVFLFGMYHLENGLKGLAGKSFKKLLQRFTNKSWKGILTGATVTAILQSSSLVTLLVVAFLGGGMITLQNSLGVVFGANLGTTVTAWVVATLGFKINVADLSYPFLAIGTFSYLLMDSRPMLKSMGSFLIGFGLLFLGLDYMKVAIETLADQVDLSQYANLGLFVYLLVGLIITALIQSSSAMIVIVLSALNAGLIDIYHAVALIIGANIGTTSTLILASIKGSADKKRLAFANVFFNLVAGGISFLFLHKLVYFTLHYLHINEPLMELVFLNTLINLIGIILFYPFLGPLGRFLNKLFIKSEPAGESMYIKNVTTEVPDVAIKALDQEMKHIFALTHHFIFDCLRINNDNKRKSGIWNSIFKSEVNPLEKYNHLKNMEDEITNFYMHLQEHNLTESESALVAMYMHKLRSMINAAKNIKDVIQNIKDMDESEDELAHEILKQLQEFSLQKIQELNRYVTMNEDTEPAAGWQKEYENFYNKTIEYLYKNINTKTKRDVPVSSMTNAIKKTVSSLEELALSASNHQLEKEIMQKIARS